MSNVHSCGLLELRGGGGEPVDFTRTVSSHGVAALPPSMISRGGRAFGTTLDLGSKRAQTVFVRRIPSGHLRVTSLGTVLEPRQQARVLNSLRAMLCLEDNLVAFYELAAADRDLSWVLSGAGRMLRSPTVFEDVVKTICTTNCAWSATVRMVTSLVRCLGKPDYRGRRAFPTPAAMAAAGDAFYRDTSRAGYRGAYLLKLVGSSGEQQFVPLCVRDDASHAAVVIQSSITTWQAYNRWGGYSLYYGNSGGALSFTHAPGGGSFANRARIVSFDRPYDHDWASGAADFVGNELPVICQAEQLGLDVTYWTDVDLHARPQLLANHRALISLGHDEYWSLEMRDGAEQALRAGVNLAFLGANACYRQIRLGSSPLGSNRLQTCYKSSAEDPMTGVDNAVVTVNWPQPPVSRPESELIGSTYQDVGAVADMVVTDAGSWLFSGTGLTQNQHLPRVVQGEFDRYVPGAPGPTNVDVAAHSIVANRGGNYSDVTWYTMPNGGGVFDSGNASWVGALSDLPLVPGNVLPDAMPGITAPLRRVMENLYAVIALGPASLTNPSQGNWTSVYTPGAGRVPAPVLNNTA